MVFGGGGQVGCHLIELASATGRDLVGLTHAEADICDADAVGAAIAKHSPISWEDCEKDVERRLRLAAPCGREGIHPRLPKPMPPVR